MTDKRNETCGMVPQGRAGTSIGRLGVPEKILRQSGWDFRARSLFFLSLLFLASCAAAGPCDGDRRWSADCLTRTVRSGEYRP